MSRRVSAYAMLTHHALNELWLDTEGCCPHCCLPCGAVRILEAEGVLDAVVREFQEYPDGTKVFRPDTNPWYVDGKVDRNWLWNQWGRGVINCGEVHA